MSGFGPVLRSRDRVLVLSPHLDDAVLSCGALIADLRADGTDVLVVTVFTGRPVPPLSDAATALHLRCGYRGDPMAEREREDDAALDVLGVRTERLGLPEALYRKDARGRPLHPSLRDVFAPPAAPGPLVAAIADHVREHLDGVGAVLAPLALGAHADHVLVSLAAARLDRPVLRYEDIPYALRDRRRPEAPALTHVATPHAWHAKLTAIECYASQHPVLWTRPASRRAALTAYATALGDGVPAERYWPGRRSELPP